MTGEIPSPTDRPKPPPPPPVPDRPRDLAAARQRFDSEVQGMPPGKKAETQPVRPPSDQVKPVGGAATERIQVLDVTGRPVDTKGPFANGYLDKTFVEAKMAPLSEIGKNPVRPADTAPKPAAAPQRLEQQQRPNLEGTHSVKEEAAAAKSIKDTLKVEASTLVIGAYGPVKFSNVELKKVLTERGIMPAEHAPRRPLSEEAATPAARPDEFRAETKEQRDRFPGFKAQQAEAERKQNHPNLRDGVIDDSARVGHAMDPNGRGIATGVWQTAYMMNGDNAEDAFRKAQVVDAAFSLIPVATRGAASEHAMNGLREQGVVPPEGTARGEAAAAEPVLPKGMSVKEVDEVLSRDRDFPAAIMPSAKQAGVDLVDSHRGENWSFHDNRADGARVFVQTIEGGTWIQLKKLEPAESSVGTVDARIERNVNDAVQKFEGPLKDRESTARRQDQNADGIRTTSVLKNPDHVLIQIEVPGFDRMPPAEQNRLREVATAQLSRSTAEPGARTGNGTMHGIPIGVRMVGLPLPKPLR